MTVKVMFETEKYEVQVASTMEQVIGEDGKYGSSQGGYIVINKETGVIEHSTVMLPGAIFQCQHFNDTLISLLTPKEDEEFEGLHAIDVPEDIVPN